MNHVLWALNKESRFLTISTSIFSILTLVAVVIFLFEGIWLGFFGSVLWLAWGGIVGLTFSKIAWELVVKHLEKIEE